ncbi:signal peptidase I [Georgenia sp. AZ-5]|uniref:signal peptidase I n=1 Tax=Georgenia sp. AZ-5 TaxID=3367526 RepID=UPI003754F747
MRSITRRLGNAVLWLVLAGVLLLAVALIAVPRLTGWVPLTVLTGSMEPTVPTGSQVVVETVDGEADAARLVVGDVITFMPYPDDPTLVTHRIVTKSQGADGSVWFTTQGDANDAVDAWTLTATQIRGVMRYHVPYAGYAATALTGSQKDVGVTVAAAALFAYAAVQLGGALRARRPGPSVPLTAGAGAVAQGAAHLSDIARTPVTARPTLTVAVRSRVVHEPAPVAPGGGHHQESRHVDRGAA